MVFAGWHLDDEIRRESSSGGVFTALANGVFADGGAVIGAAFDNNFAVRHIIIEKSADLHLLRGSRYVQSKVSPSTYHQLRELLKEGRRVFFSGTPCQVAAIRNYLQKPFDNFFCCDIVCHGVPSPKVFHAYKTMLENHHKAKVRKIVFRCKDYGWKKYSVSLSFENNKEYCTVFNVDPFMRGFLKNFFLRPSCYVCKFTNTIRPGDLSIGDFWGVSKRYPEYDPDDKGTSLVLVNAPKGRALLDNCHPFLFLRTADIETAVKGNPCLIRSCIRPRQRETFFRDLDAHSFKTLIRKYRLYPSSFPRKMAKKFRRKIKNFIYKPIKKLLRINTA
jgi:coenzyme F420-reducing hydrogenase beta subunit